MMHLPGKSSIFTQVSGITFDVNVNINSSVELDPSGMFLGVKGKRRVHNVMVGKKRLDLNKKYRVSFDNYIAGGGDGFTMFSPYEEIESTSNTDNQAFITYIKDKLNGKIPEEYRNSSNRIIIQNFFTPFEVGSIIMNKFGLMLLLLAFLLF